ncbi:hypothetical protein GCM10027217_24850 [Pseudomaricurvus hydrocarbonicus]
MSKICQQECATPLVILKRSQRFGNPVVGVISAPGMRDELVSGMLGCLSDIVSNDMQDDNAIWITEV